MTSGERKSIIEQLNRGASQYYLQEYRDLMRKAADMLAADVQEIAELSVSYIA